MLARKIRKIIAMETQKNDENIILKLKRHLGKMMVQVDFLYRNGRSLEQFDYDILMDRTREFYELLIDSQEFNQKADQDQNLNQDSDNEPMNNDVEFEIEMPGDNENPVEEKVSDEEENPAEEENDEDDFDDEDWEDEEDVTFSVEPVDSNNNDEKMAEDNKEKEEDTASVNPATSNIPEDNSLAARLQRRPISDIRSAVTLNDRIMMIHDLFKGSEERYNKTIDVLNEFPTVGGAIVYLSELRVELQWDIESEAYTKLQELVERRFLY